MARRVKRSASKQWRNIQYKVRWSQGNDHFGAVRNSASYFPKASIDDVKIGIDLWVAVEKDRQLLGIEFLAFEDFSDVWPDDGGHEWRRTSPLAGESPGECTIWYRCKNCKTEARLVDSRIVRCTGRKVCLAWRLKAQA